MSNNSGRINSYWPRLFSGKFGKSNKDQETEKFSGESKNKVFDENGKNSKEKNSAQLKNIYSELGEDTLISKGTEINGSIISRCNISVNGKVKGDVTSEANIKITGTVEGDIAGRSIEINSGNITGNITSKSTIIVSDKSVINGNVECDKLDLNGSVDGNSQVHTSATLGKDAVIHGNLTSKNLSIQEGAIVNGTVKVSKENEQSPESKYLNRSNVFDDCIKPLQLSSSNL